jgi:hypothetical protein
VLPMDEDENSVIARYYSAIYRFLVTFGTVITKGFPAVQILTHSCVFKRNVEPTLSKLVIKTSPLCKQTEIFQHLPCIQIPHL